MAEVATCMDATMEKAHVKHLDQKFDGKNMLIRGQRLTLFDFDIALMDNTSLVSNAPYLQSETLCCCYYSSTHVSMFLSCACYIELVYPFPFADVFRPLYFWLLNL